GPYGGGPGCPERKGKKVEGGITGQAGVLVDDERAQSIVQRSIDELNQDLGSWESIKYFRLLPLDFTEERGELTPTLKVKRRVVQERYRELIDTMYATPKPARRAQRPSP